MSSRSSLLSQTSFASTSSAERQPSGYSARMSVKEGRVGKTHSPCGLLRARRAAARPCAKMGARNPKCMRRRCVLVGVYVISDSRELFTFFVGNGKISGHALPRSLARSRRVGTYTIFRAHFCTCTRSRRQRTQRAEGSHRRRASTCPRDARPHEAAYASRPGPPRTL